jgi:hypothetical protein
MELENETPKTTSKRPTFSGFGFGAIRKRLEQGQEDEASALRVFNALMRKVDGGDVSKETKEALTAAQRRLSLFKKGN